MPSPVLLAADPHAYAPVGAAVLAILVFAICALLIAPSLGRDDDDGQAGGAAADSHDAAGGQSDSHAARAQDGTDAVADGAEREVAGAASAGP